MEVVDFIIHSVDGVLRKEFNRGLTDENVHILDPFTGTGTFITRLLQSGLVRKEDLQRKYAHEIHANEIVLLAYYIAAINIENVFHDLSGEANSPDQHNATSSRDLIPPHSSRLKAKGRELQKAPTPAEVLLWKKIQNRELGVQFHRLVPIDNYIVDFYCHELMLALEIESNPSEPDNTSAHDQKRQKKLESLGVRFLRFTDKEVETDIDNVLGKISAWIGNEDLAQPLIKNPIEKESSSYAPFHGILLTDTFQLGETEEYQEKYFSEMFPENSERVQKQKQTPIRVIMTNPPYSVGQKSANDNAQNQPYPRLDKRIADTYAARTNATNKNSLYDSYIKAFRWGTDRLDPKHGGIVAMVTNGQWLDGNSHDGFRKCLEEEFSSIWVFNLRGNQRTSGELSRKEGGKIFDSGSRTPISITILVKKPEASEFSSEHSSQPSLEKNQGDAPKALIHYHDIGDYLKREEKLRIIRDFGSVKNTAMKWKVIRPNEHGDWIAQRSESFAEYIPLGDKKGQDKRTFFVPFYSNGLKTQRDTWCYNSCQKTLEKNIQTTIDFYNEQVKGLQKVEKKDKKTDIKELISYDDEKIAWTRALINDANRGKVLSLESGDFVTSLYRPFFKQHQYFSRALNEMLYQMPKLFPTPQHENLLICVPAPGGNKELSVLITDAIADLHLNGDAQCFPLYYYEESDTQKLGLFDGEESSEYRRRDGITDFILERAKVLYGKRVSKEDIFYYVYGLLHNPQYREKFAIDLKKSLPRLPLLEKVSDFWAFSKAGRKLADLHINYESVPPYEGVRLVGSGADFISRNNSPTGATAAPNGVTEDASAENIFTVQKMRFPRRNQKDSIIYNRHITIENIPAKAYEYIVNGKSAIEWIMERYQVTVDKRSGIKNDANDWAEEVGNPRYILDLLLGIINLSIQTVDIVNALPEVDFE